MAVPVLARLGPGLERVKAGVLTEFADLSETAQAFGFQSIREGSWFTRFLHSCLAAYHERVMKEGGEAWLRAKYPGLPTDAVAEKLCELAEKTAAIAGGISGAAAGGAALTGGAGLPVAVTAVMAEVLFTVRLQLRLVYDLHLLYGMPLDASDPEDLLGIFAIAHGVKVAEVAGSGVKTFGPEVVRAQLYRLVHGNTQVIQAAASRVLGPRIARSITQRAILRTAVPVVGAAISAGWNYASTRLMGSRVRRDIRVSAALREETLRLGSLMTRHEATDLAVVEGLMALALADRAFDNKERVVYMAFLRQLELSMDDLERLGRRIEADLDGVCAALAGIGDPRSRESVGRCFCLIATADGDLAPGEREVLARLLAALGQEALAEDLPGLCDRFRPPDGAMKKAVHAVGKATSRAGDKVGEAAGWVKGKLRRGKKPPEPAAVEVDFTETREEKHGEAILLEAQQLHAMLAAGELSQDAYEQRWGELVAAAGRSAGSGEEEARP